MEAQDWQGGEEAGRHTIPSAERHSAALGGQTQKRPSEMHQKDGCTAFEAPRITIFESKASLLP